MLFKGHRLYAPAYKHGQGNVRAQTSDELLKKNCGKQV
jgi:hypothetical protein